MTAKEGGKALGEWDSGSAETQAAGLEMWFLFNKCCHSSFYHSIPSLVFLLSSLNQYQAYYAHLQTLTSYPISSLRICSLLQLLSLAAIFLRPFQRSLFHSHHHLFFLRFRLICNQLFRRILNAFIDSFFLLGSASIEHSFLFRYVLILLTSCFLRFIIKSLKFRIGSRSLVISFNQNFWMAMEACIFCES